jgi:uncharacterized membrane protein SpoIIM required for sporulation
MIALERFVLERQDDWARLESLLGRVRGGDARALSAQELEEMTRLYRLAASDLARARRDYPGDRLIAYLNNLVSGAYASVYSSSGFSWRDIGRWFASDFPRLFRETAGYFLVAALLFFGPGLLSFAAVLAHPPNAQVILDNQTYAFVTSYAERGVLWTEIETDERSSTSAFLMTNNIQVAIIAFAGGMLFGLLTIYVLLLNGFHLGAIFGVVTNYDLGDDLLEFVSGHGPIELSVICLASGAGLMLADALLRPGMLARGEALSQAAQKAARLLMGGAALLVVAGLIEGFISPSDLPREAKFAVGIATGLGLYAYWIFAGRGAERSGKKAARP